MTARDRAASRGPDGAAPSSRRAAPAAGLVEHRDAEPLGLLELRARRLAGDDVVGLLRHRRGHAAAGGEDPLGRLLARELRQRAGEHERLAGQRALARRRALLLELQALARAGRRSARASLVGELRVDQRRRRSGRCPASPRSARAWRPAARRRVRKLLGDVAAGDLADALDARARTARARTGAPSSARCAATSALGARSRP